MKYKVLENLSNEEILYFVNLVDPQNSASAYFLDYNFKVP
jgi:hypothetical protein